MLFFGRTRQILVYITRFVCWCYCHQNSYYQIQYEDTSIVQSTDVRPFLGTTVSSETQCYLECSHYQCKCSTVEIKQIGNGRFHCLLYDYVLSHIRTILEKNSKISSMITCKPNSCLEWQQNGWNKNGIYEINVVGKAAKVFCDMKTNGGGWTVFFRRIDGSVNFKQNWNSYKHGFGSLDGEFWLGNDLIHQITNKTNGVQIRFETTNMAGVSKHIVFNGFHIDSEADKYRMHVGNGVEGDQYLMNNQKTIKLHNGNPFTTFDVDNDRNQGNCAGAEASGGAFWYDDYCRGIRPTAAYPPGKNHDPAKHIRWVDWVLGETYTYMKFFQISVK